jgi:hypothetical protein
MFRKILTVATLACGLAGVVGSAQAMPMGASGSAGPELTLVAGGCGPGMHRGPYGGCRPNAGPRGFGPRVFAPRVFAPRCVMRRDRFGRPVRICR